MSDMISRQAALDKALEFEHLAAERCWREGERQAVRFEQAIRELPAVQPPNLVALQHAIQEATDPEFIWGAMDNVHDMDTGLTDFAKAVSRAQRAALAVPAKDHVADLIAAAEECATDLEDEINCRLPGDHPRTLKAKARDMDAVVRLRQALARVKGGE